jgi:hypothetical protein
VTAAKVIAQVGLGVSIVGVVLLAWAARVLVLASSTYDGIRPEDLKRVKWPARIGWGCVIAAAVTQSVALWLA